MYFLEAGQRINVDLSGLRVSGEWAAEPTGAGVVVDIAPGAITVRLECEGCHHREVTVSLQRIET